MPVVLINEKTQINFSKEEKWADKLLQEHKNNQIMINNTVNNKKRQPKIRDRIQKRFIIDTYQQIELTNSQSIQQLNLQQESIFLNT